MSESYTASTSVVLGVPRERAQAERRVALVPDIVKRLVDESARVLVETGAGEASSFPDRLYEDAGARIVQNPPDVYERADVILKVQPPGVYDDIDEPQSLKPGQYLVAFLSPLVRHDLIETLRQKGVEAFSMDAIPRTTRAQAMDALSSQSNLAGYKSVILAADRLGKIFPLMMTAAGTITPARVLVLGAGVAGLQAIGTAKRLGAVVYGYDVRAVVREQVESLGGRFVELDLGEDLAGSGGYAKQASEDQTRLQQEALAREAALADVVITTALIPGKPAPLLVTADAVRGMKPGSVIVDLAGETGGNCELSQAGETVTEHDVTIMAPANVPGLVPVHASQVLAKNIQNFLDLILTNGELDVNYEDDIVSGTAIVHGGEIVHGRTRSVMGLPEIREADAIATGPPPESDRTDETADEEAPGEPGAAAADEPASSGPGPIQGSLPEDDVAATPPEAEAASSSGSRTSTDPADVFDDIDGTIDDAADETHDKETRRPESGEDA